MQLSVIPRPTAVEMRGDGFELTADTVILVDEAAAAVGDYLAQLLSPATGYELKRKSLFSDPSPVPVIRLRIDANADGLGEEGYRLEASPKLIDIAAKTPAGLFYGCQTLRQLLPVQVDSGETVQGVAWAVPGLVIEDMPRFKWRGMHLDVCRHFFDKEFVKQYIDLMARYKLNTFHWHLTEDQGWRIEIKKYPKLTEVGAWRTEKDGTRYGGYYTQDDIREVVAYAQSRFITVVPEVEMPGHAQAALASYPELSCTGGPFEVSNEWGIRKDVFCAGNEQTYTFLEDVLDEVIPLFPGAYFHIGGDECPKDRWKECDKCQAKIKAEGLKDEDELQSHLVRHFDKFLAERGKKLIGWDEILEGGLAEGAAVMSWRGVKGGIAAAQLGRSVVMTPHTHLYFDFKQVKSDDELGAFYNHNPISVEKVYSYEPIPEELTQEQARFILGAQGNVWTEPIETPEQVQYMTLPRMVGLSEVVWSDKSLRDWQDFERRLIGEYGRYDLLGVTYRDHRK
jgi:hexosaminidase